MDPAEIESNFPVEQLDQIAMVDGRIVLRGTIKHIFLAAMLVGFALALGWAFYELDAAVKGAGSSLGTIATIGQ